MKTMGVNGNINLHPPLSESVSEPKDQTILWYTAKDKCIVLVFLLTLYSVETVSYSTQYA